MQATVIDPADMAGLESALNNNDVSRVEICLKLSSNSALFLFALCFVLLPFCFPLEMVGCLTSSSL